MPVNDGMLGVVNDGINGVHWSVVALDRVHKTAHYFDSSLSTTCRMFSLRPTFQSACSACWTRIRKCGIFLLKNGVRTSTATISATSMRACGPFVYAMVETVVEHIHYFQQDSNEQNCRLGLTRMFRDRFASQFHSYNVRRSMQSRIADAKMRSTADRLSSAHDRRAIAGEDVELLSEPALIFNASPRPAQSLDTGSESNSDHDSAISTVTSSSKEAVTAVDIQLPSAADLPSFLHTREDLSSSNGNDEPAVDIVPGTVSKSEVDDNINNLQELDEGGAQ